MGFIEAIVYALLWLCGVVLGFYLILWVFSAIGIALPVMVITILKVMLVLVAILVLIRLFWPWVSNASIWPRGPQPPQP